jgi:hypothetical protein
MGVATVFADALSMCVLLLPSAFCWRAGLQLPCPAYLRWIYHVTGVYQIL